jgi:hypothetical protein
LELAGPRKASRAFISWASTEIALSTYCSASAFRFVPFAIPMWDVK